MVGTDVGRDDGGAVVTEHKQLRQRSDFLNPKSSALLADDGRDQASDHEPKIWSEPTSDRTVAEPL